MKGRGGRDDLSTAVDKVVRPVNKNFDSDLDIAYRDSARFKHFRAAFVSERRTRSKPAFF